IESFRRMGVGPDYVISVSHADTFEQGRKAYAMLSDAFPGASMELLDLTCAFITQGGPKCVAIQACLRV
ncbi:MAG: DegV family protein, partial [Clostridia bacterium]|nr:DegV family protein [Clostridia bacterium]